MFERNKDTADLFNFASDSFSRYSRGKSHRQNRREKIDTAVTPKKTRKRNEYSLLRNGIPLAKRNK